MTEIEECMDCTEKIDAFDEYDCEHCNDGPLCVTCYERNHDGRDCVTDDDEEEE